MADIGSQDIILGYQWLNELNPEIDWDTGAISLRRTSNPEPVRNKPSDLPATTTGTDTQPTQEGDLYFGTHPGDATPPPDKALFSDSSKPVSEIGVPSDSQPVTALQSQEESLGVEEVRTGTSETRYADQKETHAEGQLKDAM